MLILSIGIFFILNFFPLSTWTAKTCQVIDYDCKPDGKYNCTNGIQKAIDDCKNDNNGLERNIVLFTKGKYLSYPLIVYGKMIIKIEKDAVIIMSNDIKLWPIDRKLNRYQAFIYGENVKGLTFTGKGKIEGQGFVWWEGYIQKTLQYERPTGIDIWNCEDLLIEDIEVNNTPIWGIIVHSCKNVVVRKIKMYSPIYAIAPNTDGFDAEGCEYVNVDQVYINTGDDCICAKSNTKHMIVQNSYFGHCLGATVGTGGGFIGPNVTFRNIDFKKTVWGVRVKFRDYQVGHSEGLLFEDLRMDSVMYAITINQFNQSSSNDKKGIVDIKDVTVRNVTGKNIMYAGHLWCHNDHPCTNIHLENIDLMKTKTERPEWSCSAVHGTQKNVKPKACLSPPIRN